MTFVFFTWTKAKLVSAMWAVRFVWSFNLIRSLRLLVDFYFLLYLAIRPLEVVDFNVFAHLAIVVPIFGDHLFANVVFFERQLFTCFFKRCQLFRFYFRENIFVIANGFLLFLFRLRLRLLTALEVSRVKNARSSVCDFAAFFWLEHPRLQS